MLCKITGKPPDMKAVDGIKKQIAELEYILAGTIDKTKTRIMEEIANLKIDLAALNIQMSL